MVLLQLTPQLIKKCSFKKSENVPDGGISGKPLFNNSKEILKKINNLNKNSLQIIGLGGIDSGKTAYEKLASRSYSSSNLFWIDL